MASPFDTLSIAPSGPQVYSWGDFLNYLPSRYARLRPYLEYLYSRSTPQFDDTPAFVMPRGAKSDSILAILRAAYRLMNSSPNPNEPTVRFAFINLYAAALWLTEEP